MLVVKELAQVAQGQEAITLEANLPREQEQVPVEEDQLVSEEDEVAHTLKEPSRSQDQETLATQE